MGMGGLLVKVADVARIERDMAVALELVLPDGATFEAAATVLHVFEGVGVAVTVTPELLAEVQRRSTGRDAGTAPARYERVVAAAPAATPAPAVARTATTTRGAPTGPPAVESPEPRGEDPARAARDARPAQRDPPRLQPRPPSLRPQEPADQHRGRPRDREERADAPGPARDDRGAPRVVPAPADRARARRRTPRPHPTSRSAPSTTSPPTPSASSRREPARCPTSCRQRARR